MDGSRNLPLKQEHSRRESPIAAGTTSSPGSKAFSRSVAQINAIVVEDKIPSRSQSPGLQQTLLQPQQQRRAGENMAAVPLPTPSPHAGDGEKGDGKLVAMAHGNVEVCVSDRTYQARIVSWVMYDWANSGE